MKYLIKSLTEYQSEIYENGQPTGKKGPRVWVCIQQVTTAFGGLKDQTFTGGMSLNRGVSLADAEAQLAEGQDVTGQVKFIGDADEDGFFQAVLA